MKRLGRFLLWNLVFIMVILAIDLSLIYFATDGSAISGPRGVYLDFRARLIALVFPEKDPLAEKIPASKKNPPKIKKSSGNDNEPRYVYVDRGGEIRFAASLEEIPMGCRSEAKRLDR